MSKRNRGQDWTAGEGDEPLAAEPVRDQDVTEDAPASYLNLGGPPPTAPAKTSPEPAPPTGPTDSGESEVDRLRRELAEKERLLAQLAEQGVAGRERAADLILPRGYKILSHAMKRHPRGTVLRADQFPPGVLDRMQRDGRVRPVFDLPADYQFPADAPARVLETPRPEDKAAKAKVVVEAQEG